MGGIVRDKTLPWTGERLVTTCHRPLVYEHLHRYAVALAIATGKRVLDIACGEGYGANLLASVAAKVTAVDRDTKTVAHAKSKYRRRNLHFVAGECTDIPCDDQSVDLVASFETIEHIREQDRFLSEVKRVLAPKGMLVISSPHKEEYQKISVTPNPFHERELDHKQFIQLIRKYFKYHVAAKQRLVAGSWIAPDSSSAQASAATFRGGFDGIQIEPGVYRGIYSIAICSDDVLPQFDLGMFEDFQSSADVWELLDIYDSPAQLSARISELARADESKTKQIALLQGDNEERRQQILSFKDQANEKAKHIAILQRENEEKTQQVAHFKSDTEEKAEHIAILQRENEEKTQQVAHFKSEAEEKARHILLLQRQDESASRLVDDLKRVVQEATQRASRFEHELETKNREMLSLIADTNDKANQIAQMERELKAREQQVAELNAEALRTANEAAEFRLKLDDKSEKIALLQRELDRKSQYVERLHQRLGLENERLARVETGLVEARWEIFTLRGELAKATESDNASPQILQLKTLVETVSSEREHLRGMLVQLQNDLEEEQRDRETKERQFEAVLSQLRNAEDQLKARDSQLQAARKDLLSRQNQVQRIRERALGRLILPFGKSQRKLEQLTASKRNHD